MKKRIIIALVILAAAAGFFTVQALAGPAPASDNTQTSQPQQTTSADHQVDPFDPIHGDPAEVTETAAAESAQETTPIVQTYQQPSKPAPAPQAAQQAPAAPAPVAKEQGGHVPFTNDPVTAGDPESYIGTVGQCPFYEMAGEKGCFPPADIECNADWSVCKLKAL
jgi:hypothetical protein